MLIHAFFLPPFDIIEKEQTNEIRNKQEGQALQIEPCCIITKNGYIKNNQREKKKKKNWDKEEIVPKKRKGQMMGLSSPRFP